MKKYHGLLIVIADGEHVRFVHPAADNALHTVSAIDSGQGHRRSSDIGSDRPGASYHSASTAHHAYAPRHDLHRVEKERFAQFVGERVNAAAAAGGFESLVIVAPAHALNAIRAELGQAAAERIVGTLHKDLVNVPDDELQPHLAEWVPKVHRAP